jgi:uracil-DNA glycosylase
MRWTERQRAMLREMGVHLWQPDAAPSLEGAAPPAPTGVEPPQPTGASMSRPLGPARADEAGLATQSRTSGQPAAPNVDAMGWPQLRETVAACTACRLCEGRTQTVFGTGNVQAQWMVVGEAPGEQEDLQGEPFVGKSGQLLDAMLRAIGLTRGDAPPEQQVFIANTIKCRPPGNRNPQPDEMAKCEPFLIRQIALLQPRIILAMGRFAVQSLLRSDEPVGRLRGRVHHYQGVPLIVTYHPAYLLRNPEDKSRAWDDLCLAVDTAAGSA